MEEVDFANFILDDCGLIDEGQYASISRIISLKKINFNSIDLSNEAFLLQRMSQLQDPTNFNFQSIHLDTISLKNSIAFQFDSLVILDSNFQKITLTKESSLIKNTNNKASVKSLDIQRTNFVDINMISSSEAQLSALIVDFGMGSSEEFNNAALNLKTITIDTKMLGASSNNLFRLKNI